MVTIHILKGEPPVVTNKKPSSCFTNRGDSIVVKLKPSGGQGLESMEAQVIGKISLISLTFIG